MVDSKRTFKMKVRSSLTVFEILLTSAVICMYLPNYKRHEVDQGHSKKLSHSEKLSF